MNVLYFFALFFLFSCNEESPLAQYNNIEKNELQTSTDNLAEVKNNSFPKIEFSPNELSIANLSEGKSSQILIGPQEAKLSSWYQFISLKKLRGDKIPSSFTAFSNFIELEEDKRDEFNFSLASPNSNWSLEFQGKLNFSNMGAVDSVSELVLGLYYWNGKECVFLSSAKLEALLPQKTSIYDLVHLKSFPRVKLRFDDLTNEELSVLMNSKILLKIETAVYREKERVFTQKELEAQIEKKIQVTILSPEKFQKQYFSSHDGESYKSFFIRSFPETQFLNQESLLSIDGLKAKAVITNLNDLEELSIEDKFLFAGYSNENNLFSQTRKEEPVILWQSNLSSLSSIRMNTKEENFEGHTEEESIEFEVNKTRDDFTQRIVKVVLEDLMETRFAEKEIIKQYGSPSNRSMCGYFRIGKDGYKLDQFVDKDYFEVLVEYFNEQDELILNDKSFINFKKYNSKHVSNFSVFKNSPQAVKAKIVIKRANKEAKSAVVKYMGPGNCPYNVVVDTSWVEYGQYKFHYDVSVK